MPRKLAVKPVPKTRLEEARARMYRDLVLESAEHVFAQKGFDEATMQEIAAEAGISMKTLYATLPGKNELYEAVVELRGAEFLQETAQGTEGQTGALAALEAGVRAIVSFLVRHENFLLIHLRQGRAWGVPGMEGQGGVQRDQGELLFQAVVQRGIDEGVFYDEDPQTLARLFRRLGEASGMEPGPKLQEILGRLEAGEDPDDLEAALGDDADEDESLEDLFRVKRALAERHRRPQVDDTLYFL